jgi:exodeoxyribonuclease V gamma subunit
MENLVALLNKISQVSPLGVFSKEVIIVQNPGMQHWLNLAIAEDRGISMNIGYALPSQFLWGLIKSLATENSSLEQSPYSREVLTWRIYLLLATEIVTKDENFLSATTYWKDDNSPDLKRYQLAVKLADLYEQYLIFRPNWLDRWQKEDTSFFEKEFNASLPKDAIWQGKLWKLLIDQQPYNPIELIKDAIDNIDGALSKNSSLLPKRISFFAINTMPPIWLDFINQLSQHVEINFFHLNPCFAFWGDIISEKQAFKTLSHWSAGVDDEHLFVGNPLLANFGQQGREFLALLQDYSSVNVELFVEAGEQNTNDESIQLKPCILHQIQNDILRLEDATALNTSHASIPLVDDSITITSCHSALREVQALHDYLLHQFNQASSTGETLTPKDVLVMCPQIEQYAPYVNAVFTRGWQNIGDEVPPLPCSIADRSAKDSDPLIAAFSDLLTLPDSRFQVSHLLAFLRQSAIANKFGIDSEDLDKISVWLERASIHWGLNLSHKQQILGESANDNFTWQYGLSRLLRGFAYSDEDIVHDNQLLLSSVEGSDAILLGQLMLAIEQLQQFALTVTKARTPKEWQSYLLEQLDLLFSRGLHSSAMSTNIDNALQTIDDAIASFVEYTEHASLTDKIDLNIITDFLNKHFSQGDSSRQFMVGQVTFCSMLPMRSIPFKIIAVLGLNDGEFPRQRQPVGFDLMTHAKAKLGDRSRRGDDRYLFLEAIISARQALYLSYQGRNIKNNSEKQPSIVLKELMDYLAQGYGWNIDQTNDSNIRQMAMQPFSIENYLKHSNTSKAIQGSFDANWLTLAKEHEDTITQDNSIFITDKPDVLVQEKLDIVDIDASQLIKFFQHPSKVFAQHNLNLTLDNRDLVIDDVEPFSSNYLESYLLREALLNAYLSEDNQGAEKALQRAKLSGKFPDLPSMADDYTTWLNDSEQFAKDIIDDEADNPIIIDCNIEITLASDERVCITSQLPVKRLNDGVSLVFYRSSTAKPKDLFSIYLNTLLVQVWQAQHIEKNDYKENILSEVNSSIGFYFNTKAQQVEQYIFNHHTTMSQSSIKVITDLVSTYYKGLKQPLLVNGDIAAQVFKLTRGKRIEMTQERFEQCWWGNESSRGFADDEYMQYFWPDCPNLEDHLATIEALYADLYLVVEKVKRGNR